MYVGEYGFPSESESFSYFIIGSILSKVGGMEVRVESTDMQGFMKGYISHEKSMVVLAKTNPFPNLTSIAR
jgi:hypothetical protein